MVDRVDHICCRGQRQTFGCVSVDGELVRTFVMLYALQILWSTHMNWLRSRVEIQLFLYVLVSVLSRKCPEASLLSNTKFRRRSDY